MSTNDQLNSKTNDLAKKYIMDRDLAKSDTAPLSKISINIDNPNSEIATLIYLLAKWLVLLFSSSMLDTDLLFGE